MWPEIYCWWLVYKLFLQCLSWDDMCSDLLKYPVSVNIISKSVKLKKYYNQTDAYNETSYYRCSHKVQTLMQKRTSLYPTLYTL